MIDLIWWALSGIILIITFASYWYLYKVRNLIGYHLGMNIAMISSGVFGLALGSVLGARFYIHPEWTIIVTTLIAMLTGILFGSLVDYQTLISGISSGIMGGLMGPMISFHIHNPFPIMLFCTLLVFLTFGLLCFSIKA